MKRLLPLLALACAMLVPVSVQAADEVKCADQDDKLLCKVTIKPPESGDACKAPLPSKVILGPRTLWLRWVVEDDTGKLKFRRILGQGVEYTKGGEAFKPEPAEPDLDWRTRRAVRLGKLQAEAIVNLVANGTNCPEAGPVAVIRD